MTIEVQIGICNGVPIKVTVPSEGLLPYIHVRVKLLYTFYKDAPESYRPLRYINGRPGQYGTSWKQGLQPYMAGYHYATDKAGWVYPYFEAEAAALVAAGVAEYYYGPIGATIDLDEIGKPAP